MTKRVSHENKEFPVDLSKAVTKEMKENISTKIKKDDSCFGRLWDGSTNECASCADNEVCCIFTRDNTSKKAKIIERNTGALFLDKADFTLINEDDLLFEIGLHSGSMTKEEFLLKVMKKARCSDEVAASEWIKRFKAKYTKIKFKQGIVILEP